MVTTSSPAPLPFDPLIAEAKRRARRRRYLLGVGLIAAVALAVVLTEGLRSRQLGRGSVATSPASHVPSDRLIVPGTSIAGIRFGTPRAAVEKTFGAGKRVGLWVVSYMSGRLEIVYAFHGDYTGRVQGLITRWPGFRTRSGVHVGSTRQDLSVLRVECVSGFCSRAISRFPDAQATVFRMRGGKVASVFVGSD